MGKDDGSVKKRRKLNSPPTKESNNSNENIVNPYKKCIEFEEKEADLRSPEKDATLFHEICKDIKRLLCEISDLKAKNTPEAKEDIESKQVEISLLIVALKKLNRIDKVHTKFGREDLYKEKQRVDSTHLLLQNLLYEAEHLDKEVSKCLQFKSKDEEIDLVPIDTFYSEAPEDITRNEITKSNIHQLRLARLEWELKQRRQLADSCHQLVQSKDRVSAAISATRAKVDALAPHLKDVLKATKPLQECLALKLDEKRNESRLATLLPQPLFLLYANCTAYVDAFKHNLLSVSICGEEEEARRFEQPSNIEENEPSNDSDSDQDNENESRSKKKRRRRLAKISKEERAEAKKKQTLKKHPLTVLITIRIENEIALNIIFSYLTVIRIAVVKCSVDISKPVTGVSGADVLDGANILQNLYPDDDGADSPHPATEFILKTVGIDCGFNKFISDLGRPFIWAQRMCGLDFMAAILSEDKKPIVPCSDVSCAAIENVIVTLKRRLKSRLSLMKELQELESGKIQTFDSLPVRIHGSMTQWQAISWSEYCQNAPLNKLVEQKVVEPNDLLYRAIITRQSAKLVALVALKPDYPKRAPLFLLTLHYNGTNIASNNDDLRDIERILNCGSSNDEERSLTYLMAKLLSCLDVLLECLGSAEFVPDKVMLKLTRGRTRSKPLNFVNKGSVMYTRF